MELWSNIFLEEADWATCSVSVATWRKVTEEHEGTRQIARIKSGDREIYIALGTPNNVVEGAENQIYVPSWLVDHLGVDGAGNTVEVTWLTQEAFPEATRIVLRPQDSAFYHADAKEELERALTRLGVIRTGDTILVPLESLGGYEIPFDVVLTEPANIVLAQGDEVIMEFEEALDAISSEEEYEEESEEESEEETEVVTPEPQGQTLGGEVRYLPDGRRWNPWRDAR
jgi:hypothetical protein